MLTNLSPTLAANFRLTSKKFADIGVQYIVPEVHLVIKKDSFERMMAIAEDPVFSKFVTSVLFEVDVLYNMRFTLWKTLVPRFEWSIARTGMEKPENNASQRAHRAYDRNLGRVQNQHFQKYHGYVKEQNRVIYGESRDPGNDYMFSGECSNILATAFKKSTALKTVVMENEECDGGIKYMRTAFADTLTHWG